MLLWEKMEKAGRLYHERQTEKKEKELKQYGEAGRELEKGDLSAMLISAFIVLVPAVLLILLALVGLAYFFLVH